jgi:putative ABC transport system substrate-binding protein
MRICARLIRMVGAVLLLPGLIAFSQPGTLPKLGILALSDADSIDALLDSLRDLGWIGGKTIEIVYPKASPNLARLAENMQTLLAANVDVVVAQTKLAVTIAKRSTDTLPIVMGALNGDPVAEGFAQSLQHPGGNITGSYYNVTAGGAERVAVLAELVPGITHIGIVVNPDSPPSRALADDLAAASSRRGLKVTMLEVRGGRDVDGAFAAAKQQGIEGIVTVTGAEMFAIRKEIVEAQDKYRIPAVMGSIGYAEMGGLAKLGPEIPGLWRKMAPTVDQLLRGSAKPGDLPLVTLDGFELDINLRSAQALGLQVPEAMRSRAARIFH